MRRRNLEAGIDEFGRRILDLFPAGRHGKSNPVEDFFERARLDDFGAGCDRKSLAACPAFETLPATLLRGRLGETDRRIGSG